MPDEFDYVVLGAGISGLYASLLLSIRGLRVCNLERETRPFTRASTINQVRLHLGYHYPRSMATAAVSARAYGRFSSEFEPAISRGAPSISGIARRSSLTSARQFSRFCDACGIRAREVSPQTYFQASLIESAYETDEGTFDPAIIGALLQERLAARPGYALRPGVVPVQVAKEVGRYRITCSDGAVLLAGGVFNCTYASINQVLDLFGMPCLGLKYELSEVALGRATGTLAGIGVTVMDGPFFSVLPYGRSGLHSLTAVDFTPHRTCSEPLPRFPCQAVRTACTPRTLLHCDSCEARPASAFPHMRQLARKFLADGSDIAYERSLFTMKAVLQVTEADDARPTLVRTMSRKPDFISVLTGKINAIFEIERAINEL